MDLMGWKAPIWTKTMGMGTELCQNTVLRWLNRTLRRRTFLPFHNMPR